LAVAAKASLRPSAITPSVEDRAAMLRYFAAEYQGVAERRENYSGDI